MYIIYKSELVIWWLGCDFWDPSNIICISCRGIPFVSGSKISINKKAITENTENEKKRECVPIFSDKIGNSLVRTNPIAQQLDDVTAEAIPLTFGGKTSAMTAQGSGPNPAIEHTNSQDFV